MDKEKYILIMILNFLVNLKKDLQMVDAIFIIMRIYMIIVGDGNMDHSNIH